MMKRLTPIAVGVWLLALILTLIFHGQTWANIVLLVVSVGLIALGIVAARQKNQ